MRLSPDAIHSLYVGALLLAILLTLAFLTAQIAHGGDRCLSKSEASALYPGKWLYWHTKHRCWDATPSRPDRPVRRIAIMKPRPAAPTYVIQNMPVAPAFEPWDARIK
jgi:hypothetical protein